MPQRSDKYGYRKSQAMAVGIFRERVGESSTIGFEAHLSGRRCTS